MEFGLDVFGLELKEKSSSVGPGIQCGVNNE